MVRLSALTLRLGAFMAGCFVYGMAGSPTPGTIGLDEILVAAFLIIAIHPAAALQEIIGRNGALWAKAGQALFFYGMTVPLISGLVRGHDAALILRDIIPFCFFLLPLFMQRWRPDLHLVCAAVAFIGVAFGLRVVWPVLANSTGGFIGAGYDPLYLSIAPTISFAAILCGGMAGWLLYRGLNFCNLMGAGILGLCALLPVAAMAVTLQRAGLGLTFIALLALLVIGLVRQPKRTAAPLLAALVAAICFFPLFASVADSLLHKHNLVGNNNRYQEAMVVFDAVAASPFSVLFGKGWGTTLADPAVGGVVVNYTHNIFTTYLLKTGLAGLLLAALYLYGLCRPLLQMLYAGAGAAGGRGAGRAPDPLIPLALAVPLVIDLTLYASFKSLDFGLILLLVMLWGQKLHENRR